VFVGRGSPYILRGRTDVFSVFLFSTPEAKVERVMNEQKVSEQKARHLVESIDGERADFIKHYFNMQWPTRSLYNLMVNTASGVDVAVETILSAMQVASKQPTAA
jgi:cytidylate kinase